jgi:hypothetical protein
MTALPQASRLRHWLRRPGRRLLARRSLGGGGCLGVSVCRLSEGIATWLIAATFIGWQAPLHGQQLLDRVVARVNNYAITLSDVNAALGVGVIEAPEGADREGTAIERLIDRQLVLSEVARFAPPEPDAAAVDREVAAMRARAGARLPAVMQATGLDEPRLRDIARDTLRIQAYLNQRFGTTVQVSEDEVSRYYQGHASEFTRDGRLIPFVEAEPAARQRAAAVRRDATILQWMTDLRQRVEVVKPTAR